MNPRLAAAAVLAVFVTLGLFFVMQALIAGGIGGKEDEIKTQRIDFVRLKQENELNTRRRLPNKLSVKKPPPPPPPINTQIPKPRNENLAIDGPSLSTLLELAGGPEMGAVVSDSAPLPLVQVAPIYPPRAQSRGIDGWVLVEFTITATGTVSDAQIVEGKPKVIFNRAALKAIRRWKYKPKIVDGKPVEQPGIRAVINFEIEK